MTAGLSIEGLTVDIATPSGPLRAVNGVSLQIEEGTCLGLVGESGSGKTTIGLALMGLLAPETKISGSLTLNGEALLDRKRFRAGRDTGMVFQDPMSSFNPVRSIGALLMESVNRHQAVDKTQARTAAIAALRAAGVPAPELRVDAYPHELSGGLRQRAMIALALINDPKLLIADEPTTALDPTVQLQVLRLLGGRKSGRCSILITHNLGVAAELCDRIAVLRRGAVVEQGSVSEVLGQPTHAYTQALVKAVPRFLEQT